MTPENETIETDLEKREKLLRDWFTRGSGPIKTIIDGLDIGWGGVQRWATGRMPPLEGLHLDIACGYATFLAQLGWRFPKAKLVGLNIDFTGPHRLAKPLLEVAQVQASLVQVDARSMPFPDDTFRSVSCFLGLQDIEIGFNQEGVKETLSETVRLLQPDGHLILLDEFQPSRFANMLRGLPIKILDQAEKSLDVRWQREVAERAIKLYVEGWVAQARPESASEKKKIFDEKYKAMKVDMEQQIAEKGLYAPFDSVHMIVARKHPGNFGQNSLNSAS